MLKKLFNIIATGVVSLTMVFSSFMLAAQPAYAADAPQTAILKNCEGSMESSDGSGIFCVLNIVLEVLTYGVGIAGTLGIIISGVQYLTARDNEAQMTKAKSRIINIVIGIAVYAVMWGFLQWILPGGVFRS